MEGGGGNIKGEVIIARRQVARQRAAGERERRLFAHHVIAWKNGRLLLGPTCRSPYPFTFFLLPFAFLPPFVGRDLRRPAFLSLVTCRLSLLALSFSRRVWPWA